MPDLIDFANYEAAEAHWVAHDKLNYRAAKMGLRLGTRPNDMIFDLLMLYMATKDQRFKDAIDAISEHELARGVDWVREIPWPVIEEMAPRFEETAIGLVQQCLENGASLRQAVATCAANLQWPGNSFAAANKSIERLWRASSFGRA